ncbi:MULTISPECIES: MFS transporter [Pseudomonas]|uniref:MFS transporter n=1 Tax=Pseudomonas TaxID=286 RepID=UPI001CD36092
MCNRTGNGGVPTGWAFTEFAKDLSVCEGQLGLKGTIQGVLAAFAVLLTIGVTGRFDRHHVLWFLLSLLVMSNLLVACVTSFSVLLLGGMFLGIAVSGFWTIGGSLGPRLRPEAAGKAASIIFSGVSRGNIAGAPAGTLLENLMGWRMASGAS